MAAGWSVWLTDHNGVRLADLSKNQGFEFARTANAVGSFRIEMGQGFDDSLLGKDYRVEIWREFEGESALVFAGLVDRWEGQGTKGTGGHRLHVDGKCMNHLLDKRVIVPLGGDLGPSYVFAGTQTNDTFQLSDDNGATWTNTGTPGMTTGGVNFSVLAADGSLVVTSGSGTAGEKGKIHRSTDRGNTWATVYTAPAGDRYAWALVRVPFTGTLIATIGSGTGRIIRSTDHGVTWAQQYSIVAANLLRATVAANQDILVARSGTPPLMYRSQDDGQNWSLVATLTGAESTPTSMYTLRNGYVLLGTGSTWAHVWRSTDHGVTWTKQASLRSLAGTAFTSSDITRCFIQVSSGLVLAGTRQNARVFGSSDNGGAWWAIAELASGGASVHSFMLLNNSECLAATDSGSGKVFESSNCWQTWALLSDTGEALTTALCRTAF